MDYITNRIRKVLDILIGHQEKDFIPGRNISECTREIYDYMWKYQENETPGLILLFDFEKAFDSLAWDFIHLVLKEFAFPKLFVITFTFFYRGQILELSTTTGYLTISYFIGAGGRATQCTLTYLSYVLNT